ncbi:MAG TPA: hypothetical protein EYQ50_25510 [Verrucomicrobiales bacterium]|nr:hypothetical protein [Verrucomicrobiales bacterium]
MLMDGVQVPYSEDLHSLYRELQTIPGSIASQSEDVCTLKLNAFRYRLDSVETQILQEDSNISPSLLRLFLQKMRQMDEKILIQMVGFYLYRVESGDWTED